MKTKIIIGVVIVILIAVAMYYIFINSKNNNTSIQGNTEYSSEEEAVRSVYLTYLSAGENCDIALTESIVTERTKEIVHYTCSNMANEVKCYIGRDYEVKVKNNTAVVYLIPFSHGIENPFFFTKENGEWKVDLYKMAMGLTMMGSICDSGWGWISLELRDEFCSYFEPGECPDK